MANITSNLGAVTAYADAVKQGYTGTREQFGKDQAKFAENAALVTEAAENAKEYSGTAQSAANTAINKASEASESANNASNYANNASNSANSANASKEEAISAKDEAISAKDDAETAKNDAETAKDEAIEAKNNISHIVSTEVTSKVEQMQIKEGQTVIDGTLTVEGAAADAKATGENAAYLNEKTTTIRDEVFTLEDELSIYQIADGYKIQSDGLAVIDSNYHIVKFKVKYGTSLFIKADGYFQFQTVPNVSTVTTENIVGKTYSKGEYHISVPNATYLVISESKTAGASKCCGVRENIFDKEKLTITLKNGCIVYDDWINGTSTTAGVLIYDKKKICARNYIPVSAGDDLFISSDTLLHYVYVWKDSVSAENAVIKRGYNSGSETIAIENDGFAMVIFKDANDADLSPEDADTNLVLGNTLSYHNKKEIGTLKPEINIPDYWFANNYLDNKVDRINEIGKTSDDVFAFITDVHWEYNAKHSPNIIKYLSDQCRIPRVFHGGDLADAVKKNAYDAFAKAIGKPMYMIMGNHDWFPPENGKSLYYWYDSDSDDQKGNAFGHYWYVDNVQSKIRYIALNSFVHTGDTTSSGWTYGYDSEQIAWFTNEALNVPNGYDVIVFDHNFRNTFPGHSDIINAIIAFNADTTNHGKVLCAIQGHRHWDGIFRSNGNIPIITTTCDRWDVEASIKDKETRTFGTIDEHAFEVVFVNRTDETISCLRIGAKGQDNVDVDIADEEHFSFSQILEERIVHYNVETVTTTKTLSPVTIPGTWYSSNNAVCTVNSGTVTAVKAGSAWVYSINNAGQLEAWIIKVE